MHEKAPYVLWLRNCRADSSSQVGGKNAVIGELGSTAIPVPDGFAVTTRAFGELLDAPGVRERVGQVLSEVDPEDPGSADRASAEVRRLIESIPLPQEMAEAIGAAYQALAQEHDAPDIPVALRSSATAEDSPTASFAGQHDTFLWVRGEDQVLARFKECLSSAFTARAICYRMEMGLNHGSVSVSVGVQKMVDAKVAGVLLTLNPANGDPSKALIEANWGLGMSVVGGEVAPDLYLVDKVALDIVKRVVSLKALEYVAQPNCAGIVARRTPPERREIPCLQDEEVLNLVRLGKAIEEHFGLPQNIEWAIGKGPPAADNTFILQSRPETTWARKEREAVSTRKASIQDHIVDVLMARRRPH